MTGEYATEVSDASGTLLLDVENRMLPVGIRNASTRKVRMKRKRVKATRKSLIHSQAQRVALG